MAAGMWGADPDQLDQLGNTLKRQIDAVTAVMQAVQTCFANTTWTGPARDRFEAEWNGSFRTALSRLNDAFGVTGQDCLARSQALRVAMANG
jgi:hypothetical protein